MFINIINCNQIQLLLKINYCLFSKSKKWLFKNLTSYFGSCPSPSPFSQNEWATVANSYLRLPYILPHSVLWDLWSQRCSEHAPDTVRDYQIHCRKPCAFKTVNTILTKSVEKPWLFLQLDILNSTLPVIKALTEKRGAGMWFELCRQLRQGDGRFKGCSALQREFRDNPRMLCQNKSRAWGTVQW